MNNNNTQQKEVEEMKISTFSKKMPAVIWAIILSILLTASLNTTLAQKTWSQVESGTTKDLEAVAYNPNDGTLIAVGEAVILKSIDQGKIWSTVYSEGIHFYDTQVSLNNILHAVVPYIMRKHSQQHSAVQVQE
jgi:photosystem II stability/assembly factor-like uncharacterized protein